jgi:DNA-binding cell septation regulator SpoVG
MQNQIKRDSAQPKHESQLVASAQVVKPKVEILNLSLGKKGHRLATFTAKVTFEEKYEIHFPNMRVVEGTKGQFVDVPTRKFKDKDFLPMYYLNKLLKEIIEDQALGAYEQALAEKQLEQNS